MAAKFFIQLRVRTYAYVHVAPRRALNQDWERDDVITSPGSKDEGRVCACCVACGSCHGTFVSALPSPARKCPGTGQSRY